MTIQKTIISILAIIYLALFVGFFLDLSFVSPFLDHITSSFLQTLYIFFFFLVWSYIKEKKYIRIPLLVLFGALSIGALLSILSNSFAICGEKEMSRISVGDSQVIVYRHDCGATTDFDSGIFQEKHIGFGLKKSKEIFSIYHVDNIEIEKIDQSSIKVKSINFTSLQYGLKYNAELNAIKNGEVITLKPL